MIKVTLKNGDKTRLLIARTGMNLRVFAEEIGVSHPYLSQVLSGKRNPSPMVARKISSGINKQMEDIFLISNVAEDNPNKKEEYK